MDELMTTTACTLPTAERPFRLAELDALFASAARSVRRRDEGAVRIRLVGDRGLLERVRDLAERESGCCSFFTFTIEGTVDEVDLDVTAAPEHRDILAALTGRAEDALRASGRGGTP